MSMLNLISTSLTKYSHFSALFMEALNNSTNEMKCEAHGTQQPRHIYRVGEAVSTAQRSNSLVQSINQRFLNLLDLFTGGIN